jgi:hypothetical protein
VKIKINDLKKLCNQLLENVEKLGFEEISFDNKDWYWTIVSSERENLDKEPNIIGVGSLWDDVEELNKVLNKKNPITIVDFSRIANIIIAIEETIANSGQPFIDVEYFKD